MAWFWFQLVLNNVGITSPHEDNRWIMHAFEATGYSMIECEHLNSTHPHQQFICESDVFGTDAALLWMAGNCCQDHDEREISDHYGTSLTKGPLLPNSGNRNRHSNSYHQVEEYLDDLAGGFMMSTHCGSGTETSQQIGYCVV